MDLESLSDFARFSPLGFSLLSAVLHTFQLPVETSPFSQVFRKSCRKLYKRQSVVGSRMVVAASLVGGVCILLHANMHLITRRKLAAKQKQCPNLRQWPNDAQWLRWHK